jgi:murein DD-endopeptidase MepM/ murein hydrolase activator NlpD
VNDYLRSVILLILLCLGMSLRESLFSQAEQAEETPRFVCNLDCRQLQPGEIVKITISTHSSVRYVQLRFLGRKFPALKREGSSDYLAFIGLDLGLEPGNHPLHITLLHDDGRQESLREELAVRPREFAVQRLWVDEKYVSPPAEVQERIQRESELLSAIYGMYTPMWLGEGSFIIPSDGQMSDNFGVRRVFNNQPRAPHSGVDISSPFGEPVRASNSGSVVVANDLYYSGKTVVIDHGLGVFSQYLHFSKIHVQIGDLVKKGDIIGEIGATGRVTGPHLHWGFRVSGSRIDPNSMLSLDLD